MSLTKHIKLYILLFMQVLLLSACTLTGEKEVKAAPQVVEVKPKKLQPAPLTQSQTEALYIGEMVQAVQQAIDSPNDPNSLKVISFYGTDSRYYAMVRGWLFQELVGVESQLYASKSPASIAKFQAHSNFLKQAIRRIDLE